ncbi:hypothetical protein MTO96_033657 [Rhipicephalus appendiculatus]
MAPPVPARKCLTLEQKVELIREVEKGGRQKSEIARQFGIPPSTLSTVLKNKDAVLDGFLIRKSLLQRMLVAYDANKGYSIDLLGAVHLLCHSWKELAPAKIANCFAHAGFSRSHAEDADDDGEDCDDLYEAVNSIVGGDLEGNFESFAMADADVPVVAPAMDAEIVDLLGGPDEEDEPLDEQLRKIPTVAQTQEILRLLRNRVECAGGDQDLIICLNKLEQALLAPSRSTRQSQLTDFFVRE